MVWHMKPLRVKLLVSLRLSSSCAANRSPFVGNSSASSGAESHCSLTRVFTSAIWASLDFGMLRIYVSRGIRKSGWVWRIQYVDAISQVLEVSLNGCELIEFTLGVR